MPEDSSGTRTTSGRTDSTVHVTLASSEETPTTGVVNQLGSPLKDPVRFEYGRALASRSQTKARGIAMLENGFDFPLLVPAAQLALGRIYEKDGQRDKAIAAYQEVTRLWATADSSLQPRVQEAKEAIARLTAEQAN